MKNHTNNQEKNRLFNFKMGLIVAMSILLASFEWASYSIEKRRVGVYDLPETILDLEKIKPVKIKRTKPKTKQEPNKIKVVDEPTPEPDPDPDPDHKKDFGPDPDVKDLDYDDGDDPYEEPIITMMASAVEIAPYYKECENVLDRKDQSDCSYFMIREYVQKAAHYPQMCIDSGIEGEVLVEFLVSKTGKISDVQAVRKVHPKLDKEAIKAVQKLPDLIPARQQGLNVPVIYHIPVKFTINGN